MVSMPLNIFKIKENIELMLNKSLNQLKNLIQHTFNMLSTFLNHLYQIPPTFGSTNVLKAC